MVQPERVNTGIDFENLTREREETERLKDVLQNALVKVGLGDNELIQYSIRLGLELHSENRRTYEPYVNHLLRVTIRLLDFGVIDPNIIAAAMLHDSLEDHSGELAERRSNTEQLPKAENELRELGYRALIVYTNPEIAGFVDEVSNPILMERENKIAVYGVHIRQLIEEGSPEALVLKLADFIDNAIVPDGLEDPAKRKYLDLKQIDLYALFTQGLSRLDDLLTATKQQEILTILTDGHARALERIKQAA